MSLYHTTVDPNAPNDSHALMLELIGSDRTVLDVGCATGYLAEILKARGCRVSGVEYDADAGSRALPFLERLVVGDLDALDLTSEFAPGSFDVIVFGDVLEHLKDPKSLLASAASLLAPGGAVVISIPNVAHGSLRLALLQGRWDYHDTGLLDRTHIRFYTRSTLLALLQEAGLVAVDVRRTTADILGTEIEVDPTALPAVVIDWLRSQPEAETYQFVLRAVRDDDVGALAVVSAAARRDADHVAELEQLLAAERSDLQEARERLHEVLTTKSYRALAAPRRIYGRLRRGTGL
jgi:2-polyprenyl-3-methyl-5-hydroxy-6-metoxy-1,4-benzoquinol methylase